MSSRTRQQLESWINSLDIKADSVLDIGGLQLPVKDRVKSWDVKDYKILDLLKPHESKSKQKADIVGDLNVPECDKRGRGPEDWLNSRFLECKDKFDTVFCLEVSEYLWNLSTAFDNIHYLMKHGGTLYMSFHFLYPVHNPPDLDYLRYTRAGVEKLLFENGFKVIKVIPRLASDEGMDYLWNFYRTEGMRPTKLNNIHNEVGALVEAMKI